MSYGRLRSNTTPTTVAHVLAERGWTVTGPVSISDNVVKATYNTYTWDISITATATTVDGCDTWAIVVLGVHKTSLRSLSFPEKSVIKSEQALQRLCQRRALETLRKL